MKARASSCGARVNERRIGLARALSKLGVCSRSQAVRLIAVGRVRLNGVVCRDPETPTTADDHMLLDDRPVTAGPRVYLMLNKPRGLLTTAHDEQDRATVFGCFDPPLPHVAPVGRLDKASEGLLLFTNDSQWAAQITAPGTHLDKTYHVQIDRVPDAALCAQLLAGARSAEGPLLAVKQARVLRHGDKHGWLELVLDEGRNRHLRRLLASLDIEVLRLLRVAIGPVALGTLPKGQWRVLTVAEVAALATVSDASASRRRAR